MQAPLASQVPWPPHVVAASQKVQLGPKKPDAHESQCAPVKPCVHTQAPVVLHVPWPLQVAATVQNEQAGNPKKFAAHELQLGPAKP